MPSSLISTFGKKCLGIDIGTDSIKIVEIAKFRKKNYLQNYAQYTLIDDNDFKIYEPENSLPNVEKVSEILEAALWKANIKEKKVFFSIPDFSTLFLLFDLPPMIEKDIPSSVDFEAKHQIPLPLSEVVYDWTVISKEKIGPALKTKVLLVVAPKKVLEAFQKIATICNLEIIGMEAEIFALTKLFSQNINDKKNKVGENKIFCILDIGSKSTVLSLIGENNSILSSYSLDFGSLIFSNQISEGLQVSLKEAKEILKNKGFLFEKKDIVEIFKILTFKFSKEVTKIITEFNNKNEKKCEKIIFSGGSILIPGFIENLKENLKNNLGTIDIEVIDPFKKIITPKVINEYLKKIGPLFSSAAGLSLTGLEYLEYI
jgi:type IV pilus assembly protein PilM